MEHYNRSSSNRRGSNSRYGNSRSSYGRGGRSGGRRNGFGNSQRIDVNKFVKKAQEKTETVEYKPSFKFADLEVNQILKDNIARKGFILPTPVQDQSIRQIMQGKDLLGVANTGTGKTGAFLIPLFEKIVKNRKEKVLVIVPTRELAEQINDEFFILSRNLRIFSVACIGGNYIGKQIYQLKKGYNFVIGTPGRLIDLNKRGELNMGGFSTIVLDEVDRMLEMGFIDDIKFLIEQLPEKRQSLFFSATINPKVENVINLLFKKEYAKVSVRTGETAENVNQDIVRYGSPSDKLDKLTELLEGKDLEKVLIFVNTKRFVDKLEEILLDRGYKVESIHGDKRQSQRRKSITNFKTGNSKILIATDVAARGLDINGVSHVINYDIPDNFEDYIHRIGRTGRANHLGTALTFVEHRQTAKY